MKKYLIAIAACFMLGACDNSKTIQLACGGHNIKVQSSDKFETLTATVDDRFTVKMDHTRSADGALYVGEVIWGEQGDLTYIWQLMLWNKGENWMASIDTGFDLGCEVVK